MHQSSICLHQTDSGLAVASSLFFVVQPNLHGTTPDAFKGLCREACKAQIHEAEATLDESHVRVMSFGCPAQEPSVRSFAT